MNLSEMRRILTEHRIQLTRSLGQCFLHDGNQLRRIVEIAGVQAGDRVLEIGPGLGPLTELLLASEASVTAIEVDARFVRVLEERFKDRPNLSLIHGDALDYVRHQKRDWQGWKVVSNLPYSVGSPILVELSLAPEPPDEVVVTLQLEVVKRLLAHPGRKDIGVLTLLVGLSYEPTNHFKIPSSCFFPPPDVGSACVRLVRRPDRPADVEERRKFVNLVKLGFSRRRKMMAKLLRARWAPEVIRDAFAATGLDETVRAEVATREQFIELNRRLPD